MSSHHTCTGLIPSPIEVKPTIYEQAEQVIQDAKDKKAARAQAKREAEREAAAPVCSTLSIILWLRAGTGCAPLGKGLEEAQDRGAQGANGLGSSCVAKWQRRSHVHTQFDKAAKDFETERAVEALQTAQVRNPVHDGHGSHARPRTPATRLSSSRPSWTCWARRSVLLTAHPSPRTVGCLTVAHTCIVTVRRGLRCGPDQSQGLASARTPGALRRYQHCGASAVLCLRACRVSAVWCGDLMACRRCLIASAERPDAGLRVCIQLLVEHESRHKAVWANCPRLLY